ncbi:MAG: M24 family metallopeptidase, partial [Anaeromyxobacteraceae bacterium]
MQLKSADDLARMRDAGRVVRAVLDEVAAAAVTGVTTGELDRLAEDRTRALGAVPAFKGYLGYPASICISVNDEVVHGIPSAHRVLRDGDLVGLDFGAIVGGFHGDAAETVVVGQATPEALRLVQATREALAAGVAAAVVGGRLGDIGAAVQR